MQQPGCERGFSLLHQSVHRDWSSALYCFLHMAELLLDVLEPLLPLSLPCFLLTKDGYGSIASIVRSMSFLIAILSGGFVRITLPSLASFSFSICFSRRVEVLLLFLGKGVWAFLGLSCLLGALHFPGELFQLSQQTLVGEAERLHLIRIGLYSFWCISGRSAIYVTLLVLHPLGIGVAPACVPSRYHQSPRDQLYL